MSKAYQSEAWLRLMYLRRRKSPEEIAAACHVSPMTIYRYLDKFGLKR